MNFCELMVHFPTACDSATHVIRFRIVAGCPFLPRRMLTQPTSYRSVLWQGVPSFHGHVRERGMRYHMPYHTKTLPFMILSQGTCVNVGCVPKKVMFNTGTQPLAMHTGDPHTNLPYITPSMTISSCKG